MLPRFYYLLNYSFLFEYIRVDAKERKDRLPPSVKRLLKALDFRYFASEVRRRTRRTPHKPSRCKRAEEQAFSVR